MTNEMFVTIVKDHVKNFCCTNCKYIYHEGEYGIDVKYGSHLVCRLFINWFHESVISIEAEDYFVEDILPKSFGDLAIIILMENEYVVKIPNILQNYNISTLKICNKVYKNSEILFDIKNITKIIIKRTWNENREYYQNRIFKDPLIELYYKITSVKVDFLS